MTDFSTIAPKLGRFIRLLSSSADGEVLAAARALNRALTNAGADLHALAAHVEGANGSGAKLSEADMRKIYDAGYDAGVKAVESKHKFNDDGFRDAIELPSANEMARWCQKQGARLSGRERDFIDSVAARSVWRKLSEKQDKWLRSIFCKLGGGE